MTLSTGATEACEFLAELREAFCIHPLMHVIDLVYIDLYMIANTCLVHCVYNSQLRLLRVTTDQLQLQYKYLKFVTCNNNITGTH